MRRLFRGLPVFDESTCTPKELGAGGDQSSFPEIDHQLHAGVGIFHIFCGEPA